MPTAPIQRLQALLRGIEDLVLVHTPEGRILDCNEAACEMLGYSRTELLQLCTQDIESAGDDLDAQIAQHHERARGVYETRHRRRDGHCIPVDVRQSQIDYSGHRAHVSVARDITHRKEMESALRESEEKYRRLFEACADGVLLLEDVILDCNPAVCRIWGYSRQDIIGRRPEDFSPTHQPDGRTSARAAQVWIHAALAGQPALFTWQHRRQDGRIIDTEVALTVVRYRGTKVLQATVRDVTERNQDRQRIEHLNAVLRAIRDVNQLIAPHVGSSAIGQRGV
jgi:PAS domain S-box-containing protein